MKKNRRNYTPEEKVRILRRHLIEQVPVSDLCDEYDLHPTVFYRWQKQFFEEGAAVFENRDKSKVGQLSRKIDHLEEKLQKKNEVVAELMEEHIKLKKSLGET